MGTRDDLIRLGHPPDPYLALRELTSRGPDDVHASLSQQREVRLCCRVFPHTAVHGGRDEKRPVVGKDGLGEHVVCEAVCKAGHRVCGQRCDDDEVGVLEMGIEPGR